MRMTTPIAPTTAPIGVQTVRTVIVIALMGGKPASNALATAEAPRSRDGYLLEQNVSVTEATIAA